MVVEKGESSADPLPVLAQSLSAQIDGRWAGEILSGRRSPITVLQRRLGNPSPSLLMEVAAVVADRSVRRITWRKHLRRRLAPVVVPWEGTNLTLRVEFDRVSTPEGQLDFEIDVRAEGAGARESEAALRQHFLRAGIAWLRPRPSLTRHRVVRHLRGALGAHFMYFARSRGGSFSTAYRSITRGMDVAYAVRNLTSRFLSLLPASRIHEPTAF